MPFSAHLELKNSGCGLKYISGLGELNETFVTEIHVTAKSFSQQIM